MRATARQMCYQETQGRKRPPEPRAWRRRSSPNGGRRQGGQQPSSQGEQHVQKFCGERRKSTSEDVREGQCGWNGQRVEQQTGEVGTGQVFLRPNLYHHLYPVLWVISCSGHQGHIRRSASAGWRTQAAHQTRPKLASKRPRVRAKSSRTAEVARPTLKSTWNAHILSLRFCVCGPVLKSLFNLCQYCSWFTFWPLGSEVCGILDPWPETKPTHPVMESKVSAPGPPGKSPKCSYSYKQLFGIMLYYFSAPKRKLKFKWFKHWWYAIISHGTSSKERQLQDWWILRLCETIKDQFFSLHYSPHLSAL